MANLDLFGNNNPTDLTMNSDQVPAFDLPNQKKEQEIKDLPKTSPVRETDNHAIKYVISADRAPELKKILDKMVDTAAKKGFPKMHYTLTKPYLIKDPNDSDELISISVIDVTVHYPAFGLGDYRLLAKLDHVSAAAPLLSRVTNFDEIPKRFLAENCPPNCDHCAQNRNRNITWLLKHKETGQVSQIGSSCVSEYTKYDSADAYLTYFSLIIEDLPKIIGAFDPFYEEGMGTRVNGYAETKIILATALAVMHREGSGYISSSKGNELNCLSTSELVANALFGQKKIISRLEISHFFEEAENIIDWAKTVGLPEKFKNTAYGHNQTALINAGGADEKRLPLIVSLIPFYQNNLSEKNRLDSQKVSTHQGVEKEKITRTLTCFNQFENNSQWGTNTTKIFSDEDGNIYKYTSGSHNHLAIKGQPYEAKMTVKEHALYKGVPQTVITRVNFPAIDALTDFCETTDLKKAAKYLAAIPADLKVKEHNGKITTWFNHFTDGSHGFRGAKSKDSILAEKLQLIFEDKNHSQHVEHYVSSAENLLDYITVLQTEDGIVNRLIETARKAGGKFEIENSEAGVCNTNILTSACAIVDRLTQDEFKLAQRYLGYLGNYYHNIPTISDEFIARAVNFIEKHRQVHSNIHWHLNLKIDNQNDFVLVFSKDLDQAEIILNSSEESKTIALPREGMFAEYNGTRYSLDNVNSRNSLALAIHNSSLPDAPHLDKGISFIQLGSSGSCGSGFS